MSGHFKVKAITDLNTVQIGQEFSESDYSTLTPEGKFVQLAYEEVEAEATPFKVEPGIYSIMQNMSGLYLEKTSFTQDKILEDFVNTVEIEEKAACFFRNVGKYKEWGIDVPTRKILLYGAPGGGKTTALARIANKYHDEGKTAVVIFPTEKFEAYQIKDFVKTFEYVGIDRLILVMEDIGGVEMEEVRRSSDSGLLSLLDNQEKTLKIPTLVIATTNYPEVFMGNLMNRPGRFDDKIKTKLPVPAARVKLAEFFVKRPLEEVESKLLLATKAEGLSPAHIKEIVIRSAIHEKTLEATIKEVIQEIEEYNKAFKEGTGSLGLKFT